MLLYINIFFIKKPLTDDCDYSNDGTCDFNNGGFTLP